MEEETPEFLIAIWRQIIVGNQKSWVLFQNGTCIILTQPGTDLRAQALSLMKEWGPVHVGSPAGDFATITLTDAPGWVVTGHHPDMLTYVSPAELEEKDPSDLLVGLLGRSKRSQDGEDPQILHVEDKRGAGA